MSLQSNYCRSLLLASNLIRKGVYMIDFDKNLSDSSEHLKLKRILVDLDKVISKIISQRGTDIVEMSEKDLESFLAELSFLL